MTVRPVLRLSPILLLLLFPASQAHAQFGAIGVKGGANWTSLNGGPPTDGGNGFIGGIYAAGQSASIVAQFEVLLSKRTFFESAGSARVNESFIQIPALFGVRGGGGVVNAMLYAGPSLSLKTSCNVQDGGLERSCRSTGLVDRGSLWSMILGMAVDYQMGQVVLVLDGRYDNGLTNAFENRDGKWRSWVLMFGIGYLMPT